jgi:RNA polymerase sigma-70 factor (ECF subfamily)
VDVLGFSHQEVSEVLEITPSAVNSLLSRAREAARARPTSLRVDPNDHRVRDLLARYLRAWQMADVNAFVQLVADDVRLSMPPLPVWFEGRDAVAQFVDQSIFAHVRPEGVPLHPGWCNGQPAFATYQPDEEGHLVAGGLQVLELGELNSSFVVKAIVSFRIPELPARCGFPATIT